MFEKNTAVIILEYTTEYVLGYLWTMGDYIWITWWGVFFVTDATMVK